MSKDTEKKSIDLSQLLREVFTNEFRKDYTTVGGVSLPIYYNEYADAINEFQVRDDDIWVCSFPKAGTTWTQEMVWCIANDLDFEGAKIRLNKRFPFLEMSCLVDYSILLPKLSASERNDIVEDNLKTLNEMASPRFIKSHLPFELLPRALQEGRTKAKIIYVSRNVKDTCISYFHHCQLFESYQGDFEQFCQLFLGDKLSYCPFWKHVLDFWMRRNDEKNKILFLKFEDMKFNLASVIQRTAAYLNKPYLQKEKLEILLNHLSFSSMKNNYAVNKEEINEFNKKYNIYDGDGQFIRSGQVQQWKEAMSNNMVIKFDNWTDENLKNFPDFIN